MTQGLDTHNKHNTDPTATLPMCATVQSQLRPERFSEWLAIGFATCVSQAFR